MTEHSAHRWRSGFCPHDCAGHSEIAAWAANPFQFLAHVHSHRLPLSFIHESTTLFASPQFFSPASFNLSQLGLGLVSEQQLIPICRTGRLRHYLELSLGPQAGGNDVISRQHPTGTRIGGGTGSTTCLLYTSDAADEEDSVDLG